MLLDKFCSLISFVMISFIAGTICFDMFCGDKFSDNMFCIGSKFSHPTQSNIYLHLKDIFKKLFQCSEFCVCLLEFNIYKKTNAKKEHKILKNQSHPTQ